MGQRLSLALFGREEPADPSYKNAIIHFRRLGPHNAALGDDTLELLRTYYNIHWKPFVAPIKVSSDDRVGTHLHVLYSYLPDVVEGRGESFSFSKYKHSLALCKRSGAVLEPRRTFGDEGVRPGDTLYVRVFPFPAGSGVPGTLGKYSEGKYGFRALVVAEECRFRAQRRECWIGHQDEGSALNRIPTPLVDEIVRFFTPLSIVNPRPRNKEHAGVIEIHDGYELWLPRQAAERQGYQFREGRIIPPPRSSPLCVIS